MQKEGYSILLSASDLVGHLHCRRLTALDIEVANGKLEKPKFWDPFQEILQERGCHEEGTIEHLKSSGLAVAVIEGVGVQQGDLGADARGDGSGSGSDRVIAKVVMPAHAGIQDRGRRAGRGLWIPAFAGMTRCRMALGRIN